MIGFELVAWRHRSRQVTVKSTFPAASWPVRGIAPQLKR